MDWFIGWIHDCFMFLDTVVVFNVWSLNVSFMDLVGAGLVVLMVVGLFWKGAKA